MKRAIAAGLLCLCVAFGQAQDAKQTSTNKLIFTKAGFAIAPLDEPGKGTVNSIVTLYLPISEGDALDPDVLVMIHHFSTGPTMDQFVVINREMLKNSKYTLLSDSKILNDTWTVEYSGQRDAQAFHWYRRVVRKGSVFYEITATATEEQWKAVSDKLKACVDSFETIEGQAGASASTTNPASQPVR